MKSTQYSWEKRIPGKWILAGEHAVLRGVSAIVFPLSSRYLECKYIKNNEDFKLEIQGVTNSELKDVIVTTFYKVLENNKISRESIKGSLELSSHIQFGAGMGASATLAVGITLFLDYLGLIKQDLFTFAKEIEDYFHGESSGVDVAIALEQRPLVYSKNKPWQFLEQVQLPRLYLSYSGETGATKTCVNHVKQLFQENKPFAEAVDLKMQTVVESFLDQKMILSFDEWKRLLDLGESCFEDWQLVTDKVREHIAELKKHGAAAVKLTGSGGGGYVLSLWPSAPQNTELLEKLIPLS